mgnify:CR=1 FL=1
MIENSEEKRKKSVLLIRLSSLGDLVLLTSTIELLYSFGTSITLLTSTEYRDLFEEDPRIKELIVYKKNRSLSDLVKEVRRARYDYAFDLHRKPLTQFILRIARAKKKLFPMRNMRSLEWARNMKRRYGPILENWL